MYEILDRIADSFNPTLFLLSVTLLFLTHRDKLKGYFIGLFASVVWVYGIQEVDSSVGIWRATGLDYSTHSAVALAVGLLLTYLDKRYALWVAPLIAAYFGLEIYQQYHSVLDIITTSLAMIPLLLFILRKRLSKPE
jgi:hypothetical protein